MIYSSGFAAVIMAGSVVCSIAPVLAASPLPPTPDPTFGLPLPRPGAARPEAQWIWAAQTADNQTVALRSILTLTRVPASVTVLIAADDYFTLYVNGQRVDGTAPDPKVPEVWKLVRRVEIARFLRPGRNVIAIQAQNAIGPAGVVARVEGAKSASLALTNGETWRAIIVDGLPSDWMNPAFNDAAWPKATIVAGLDGGPWQNQLIGWPNYPPEAPYLAHMPLRPVAVETLPGSAGSITGAETLLGKGAPRLIVVPAPIGSTDPTCIVLDFGREVAGRMRVTGLDGAVCVVSPGESREEAMKANFKPPTELKLQTGKPQFTPYSAFRYVKITFFGATSFTLSDLGMDFKYYPARYRGSFACSDSTLTKLWYVGAYTAHLGMQEDIWDGPKRDRGLWCGDLQVSGQTIDDVFADTFLMERDIDSLRAGIQAGRPDTALPVTEINGIPGYSAAWFCLLADFYRHVGDDAFLRRQHDRIVSLLEFQKTDFDADNLFTNSHKGMLDFVDWSDKLTTLDGDTADARAATHMMVVHGVREAVYLLGALGDKANAAKYARWADTLTEAARRHIADSATRTYTTRRQVNAMAVLAKVPTLAQQTAIYDTVLKSGSPDEQNDLSPYYSRYYLEAESRLGHSSEALDYARRYWSGMLDQGATTFWETFSLNWPTAGPNLIREPNGNAGESLCHAWSSGVTSWLTEWILGVRPTSGGFRTVVIQPNLCDLQWAEGDVPTPRGPIHLRVEKLTNGRLRCRVTLPVGANATLVLPGKSTVLTRAGTYTLVSQ